MLELDVGQAAPDRVKNGAREQTQKLLRYLFHGQNMLPLFFFLIKQLSFIWFKRGGFRYKMDGKKILRTKVVSSAQASTTYRLK